MENRLTQLIDKDFQRVVTIMPAVWEAKSRAVGCVKPGWVRLSVVKLAGTTVPVVKLNVLGYCLYGLRKGKQTEAAVFTLGPADFKDYEPHKAVDEGIVPPDAVAMLELFGEGGIRLPDDKEEFAACPETIEADDGTWVRLDYNTPAKWA